MIWRMPTRNSSSESVRSSLGSGRARQDRPAMQCLPPASEEPSKAASVLDDDDAHAVADDPLEICGTRPKTSGWQLFNHLRGEGRERASDGGRGRTLSPGATAIEGTSCGLGAKLEGAAVGAYGEKYRFAPGFSVECGELEKHLIASRSRRSVPIRRSCMESRRYVPGSCARMLEIGTLTAAVRAIRRPPKKVT
jgi:hypothetical protein